MMTKTVRLRPTDCCDLVTEPATLAPDDFERLLAAFKALADGTRLQIFRLIAAQPEAICACDVVDRFDVSQPTIAHHLKVLRQAGLITVSRRGIWAYYAVAPHADDLLESATDRILGDVRSPVTSMA
jgi:ArsR family transcriptional regulator